MAAASILFKSGYFVRFSQRNLCTDSDDTFVFICLCIREKVISYWNKFSYDYLLVKRRRSNLRFSRMLSSSTVALSCYSIWYSAPARTFPLHTLVKLIVVFINESNIHGVRYVDGIYNTFYLFYSWDGYCLLEMVISSLEIKFWPLKSSFSVIFNVNMFDFLRETGGSILIKILSLFYTRLRW